MAEPFGANGVSVPQEVSVAQVNHLPLVAHFARRLGPVEIVNECTLFVSRLPATYNEHERVILAAIEADDWQAVGSIAQTAPTKNRPGASYRLHEGPVMISGKAYRAVVVHSSAHDRRRLKRLEREIQASRTEITQVAKETEKQSFFCRPDAEAAAAQGRTLPDLERRSDDDLDAGGMTEEALWAGGEAVRA